MFYKIIFSFYLFTVVTFAISQNCELPKDLVVLEKKISKKSLQNKANIKKYSKQFQDLCIHLISFQEAKYNWEMLLVHNLKRTNGPFWFLPHDNENTAFKSALYGIQKYGGGLLAVQAKGNRYFKGQDPNRNFGLTKQTAKTCKNQQYPAPKYSKYIFKIIDTFKNPSLPYLALHNNKDGWYGNGGSGGISILKTSSIVHSYSSGDVLSGRLKGIKDEDSLVYIAGTGAVPSESKLKPLMDAGMHVKYEVVNENNNDCSMSNYVVLNKKENYYNIETEHGDAKAQKKMIDLLMKILKVNPLALP